MLKLFCFVLCFLISSQCFAENPVKKEPHSIEVGFLTSFLYSQEYTRNFFADYDSDVRPLPANVLLLHGEFNVWNGTHLVTSISIPTREETVFKKNEDTWTYYYPKTLLIGVDTPIWIYPLKNELPLEVHAGIGLNTPLSHRFGDTVYPAFSLRCRLAISESSGIQFGVGYVGNIARGAWMLPFGFSYRI